MAVLEAAPAGDPVQGFTDAWTMMAAAAGVVALLALALGRVRAGTGCRRAGRRAGVTRRLILSSDAHGD